MKVRRLHWSRVCGFFVLALVLTLLACSRPQIAERSTPAPAPEISSPVSPPSISPTSIVEPAPQVSLERLMGHVEALNYERYTDGDRQRTRDYLAQVLQQDGWSTREQVFETGVNLIAQRPEADPNAGNILVAAHYDSVNGSPGADDNVSAVAAALEVAQLLGQRSAARNLQLVFFDQEEAGLVGSYAYVEQAENLKNVDGVVVLEMLGYACHTVGCQKQPPGLGIDVPSQVGDFLAVVGDAEHRPLLEAFQNPAETLPKTVTVPVPVKGILSPIMLLSDHTPFWYKNIGAVMVTDTAFLRNPHYHRRSDTPNTFDQAFFGGATQIVVDTTTAFLEGRTSLETSR